MADKKEPLVVRSDLRLLREPTLRMLEADLLALCGRLGSNRRESRR
jgi:hypothetical protein